MSSPGSTDHGKVNLPMYNLPEMRSLNAAFWAALRVELTRRGLDDTPDALDFERRPVPARIEADTIFTQVCGYPLQTIYRGQATILGAPVYAAEHCNGASHAGVFIVHRDSSYRQLADLRGCRFVYNSRHSNSGMNLPRRSLANIADGQPFFGTVTETHSQPGNIERVSRGEADASCVDCVTYAFFCRHRPVLGRLTRVLAMTPPIPSIPFATSNDAPEDVNRCLRDALSAVARSEQWASERAGLMLRDIVPIDPASYEVQLTYEQEAKELDTPSWPERRSTHMTWSCRTMDQALPDGRASGAAVAGLGAAEPRNHHLRARDQPLAAATAVPRASLSCALAIASSLLSLSQGDLIRVS